MIIKDSTILLTGATGGIGQAISRALADHGAKLILIGRDEEKLSVLRNSLAHPEIHDALVADITSTEGLYTIETRAKQKHKVDVLINNAGCNDFSLLSQKDRIQIEADIQVNLIAPILLSQSSLSWLNQPGVILNIGSTFGSIGYPGYTSYCAAKAGLHRFTESLDRELFATGIRALYLAPRATETTLNSSIVNEMNQKLRNKTDDPKVVAEHVVLMLEKEISAKWIGWPEKIFARINQLLPNVVSSAIKKQQDTIHHYVNRLSH